MSLKLKFEKQCQLVVDNLEKEYSKEIRFNGAIKTIHSKFLNAIGKAKLEENLVNISFSGCVRMFVDDTTDYLNPIIKEIEKAEAMLEKIKIY